MTGYPISTVSYVIACEKYTDANKAKLLKGIAVGAGLLVFVLLGAIAVFLVLKALPAFHADKSSFWSTKTWDPDASVRFGIAALVFGTLLSSLLALLMAVPVALGVSLYI